MIIKVTLSSANAGHKWLRQHLARMTSMIDRHALMSDIISRGVASYLRDHHISDLPVPPPSNSGSPDVPEPADTTSIPEVGGKTTARRSSPPPRKRISDSAKPAPATQKSGGNDAEADDGDDRATSTDPSTGRIKAAALFSSLAPQD